MVKLNSAFRYTVISLRLNPCEAVLRYDWSYPALRLNPERITPLTEQKYMRDATVQYTRMLEERTERHHCETQDDELRGHKQSKYFC